MATSRPVVRPATRADLSAVVGLLSDDVLGRAREGGPEDEAYARAFAAIERDPNNTIYVIDADGAVVGCAQLTVIPGLSRRALTRSQIESVRIAASHRGAGLGRWFLQALIDRARERGCGLVQLTTDKARADAHRFYESLGFTASHEGYKLPLG